MLSRGFPSMFGVSTFKRRYRPFPLHDDSCSFLVLTFCCSEILSGIFSATTLSMTLSSLDRCEDAAAR